MARCGSTSRNFTGTGITVGSAGANVTRLISDALRIALTNARNNANDWINRERCPVTCFFKTHSLTLVSRNAAVTIIRDHRTGRVIGRSVRAVCVMKATIICSGLGNIRTTIIDKHQKKK